MIDSPRDRYWMGQFYAMRMEMEICPWACDALKPSIRLARRSVTTPRSIRHQPELLLDALEPGTFYDTNCRAGQGDFNGSKLIEKYEDLIPKMRLGILPPRACSGPQPASTCPRPDRFLRADYPTYFKRHNCSSESVEFKSSK